MKTRLYVLPLVAAVVLCAAPLPAVAQVSVGISLTFGSPPPPIPVYEQPVPPGPDYIWTPGYWDGSQDGYYWVPGTWVYAPEPGLLWTPGYWAWDDGAYAWTPGYWANDVGFYGGVNYGNGYFGNGYDGGSWSGNVFQYNAYVTHVDDGLRRHHAVYYNSRVYVDRSQNRVSYDGGSGGLRAHASAREFGVSHGRHLGMTSVQRGHVLAASHDRSLFARVNHSHPQQLAVAHPLGSERRTTSSAAQSRHGSTVAHHATAVAGGSRIAHHSVGVAHHPTVAYAPHHSAPVQHYASTHHSAPTQHSAPAHHYASHQMSAPGAGRHSHGGGAASAHGRSGTPAHGSAHHQHT
jgi:hypothetical protein